jgi:hypothetical protein
MSKAVKVVHEKTHTAEGIVVELKVWQVPKSPAYPEGVKYRWFAVYGGKVLVGYDNHPPKGHHGHWKGSEESYPFSDFDTLRADFARDLAEVRQEIQNDGTQNDSDKA